MKPSRGLAVEGVKPGSPAAKAGLMAGDIITHVDGQRIADTIDYMFNAEGPEMELGLRRGAEAMSTVLVVEPGGEAGLEFAGFNLMKCNNKCVFCFVSQLPRGMRKPLYLKDDDYRMSFLYGNYVTLTNISDKQRSRIVEQRLSPIYVSVHATDDSVRRTMLGNPKAPPIMKELAFFKKNSIRMHTQVVLCPGYNDGDVLRKTIRDLYSLHPHVESIAIVPVGLTDKGARKLAPMGRDDALKALDIVEPFQRRFRKKHGDTLVYGSDELYIKAGRPFPKLSEYMELPQYENGVGMVPLFRSEARRANMAGVRGDMKYLTFTGESFHPYLKRFADRLVKSGADIAALPVANDFFGRNVTVAGLLTGRDVISQLRDAVRGRDVLLVPDIMLKHDEEVFLDDVSVKDIAQALGIKSRVIASTPAGLVDALK